MSFELPALPYAQDALEPHLSAESFEYHYGKHHRAYVNKLNDMTAGKPDASKSLEEIIASSEGVLFNQAAQAWNHEFFWNNMKPGGGGRPSGAIASAIDRDFGDYDKFKDAFLAAAGSHFGSGWAWLVQDADKLSIATTANADNPVRTGKTCLIGVDVWEHTYYIDYRNDRGRFLNAFVDHLINWDFANARLK